MSLVRRPDGLRRAACMLGGSELACELHHSRGQSFTPEASLRFACVHAEIFIMSVQNPNRTGKAGWIVLWLLGVPIPVLLILFLIRGCT